ncbi:MAG: hypothetical protein ACRD0H_18750, partial [Actinomycetes bacterium]
MTGDDDQLGRLGLGYLDETGVEVADRVDPSAGLSGVAELAGQLDEEAVWAELTRLALLEAPTHSIRRVVMLVAVAGLVICLLMSAAAAMHSPFRFGGSDSGCLSA